VDGADPVRRHNSTSDRLLSSGRGYSRGMPESADSELRFVGISLDCAEPAELATFYLNLLGGKLLWHKKDSVGVRVPGVLLIMQRMTDYQWPEWPGASIVHLDLSAGEHLDEPERRAIALGRSARGTPARYALAGAPRSGRPPVLHHHGDAVAGDDDHRFPVAEVHQAGRSVQPPPGVEPRTCAKRYRGTVQAWHHAFPRRPPPASFLRPGLRT
jgi:hypothetical protein